MKKFLSLLLVCLMVVPFGMLAGVSVSADTNTVYIADSGDDANTGAASNVPVKTFEKAYELLGTEGGAIVIVGEATYAGYVNFPEHTGKITITGAGVGDVLHIGAGENRFIMAGPTEFDNIKFDTSVGSIVLVYQFHDITVTDTVTLEGAKVGMIVAAQSANLAKPSYNYTPKDCNVVINGGTWNEVTLASRSAGYGYVDDEGNQQTKAFEDFKDYHVNLTIGGKATINKVFLTFRTNTAVNEPIANSSVTFNLNGGVITHFAGLCDQKNRVQGYENGVVINIGKDYDITKSFNQVTPENRVSGGLFYGLDGEHLYDESVLNLTATPLNNTTLVVADEIYDTITASDKVALDSFLEVKKASEVAPVEPPVDPDPETPVDPDPETPVDPDPETPVDPKPENPVDPKPENPDTGDMAVVAIVAVMAMSAAAVVVLKKREN